jgi:hypothetical protein
VVASIAAMSVPHGALLCSPAIMRYKDGGVCQGAALAAWLYRLEMLCCFCGCAFHLLFRPCRWMIGTVMHMYVLHVYGIGRRARPRIRKDSAGLCKVTERLHSKGVCRPPQSAQDALFAFIQLPSTGS